MLAQRLKIIFSKSFIMKTKTVLLWGTLICFCFIPTSAQTVFGLKGGVNIANVTENPHKPRISGHGGIFANRAITKNFKIQPEVLFSGEGHKLIISGDEHVLAIDVIQIPFMLQFYPAEQVYLEAGPQVGILISAKDKVVNNDAGHRSVKSLIADAQFAIAAGLGLKVTDRVIVYGRYTFGLTDITSYDPIVQHCNVGQIGIAIRLKTL